MTSKPESTSPLQGFTLLTGQEIWGDNWRDYEHGNGQLQVMKSYGTKTGMSDLAVLLGSAVSSSNTTTSDGQRAAFVWSASTNGDGDVRTVDPYGTSCYPCPSGRQSGVRPALPSSVASSIRLSDSSPEALAKGEAIRGEPIRDTNGQVIWNDVILFGEYPQTIADENITSELKGLSEAQLKKMETGKIYTFNSEKHDAFDKPFNANEYAEYQHKGKKYIRVEAKPCLARYPMLSNGEQAQKGQSYWVEVQPIEWLKDPSGMLVARQAILGGVQFDTSISYKGEFQDTDMYRYLNTHFAKDIIPSRSLKQSQAKDENAKPPSGWPAAASWAEKHPSTVTTPWGEAVQDPKSGEWIAR